MSEGGADGDARAAGRTDAASRRLSRGPRGGGWGAAGEGRRRGCEGECENQSGTCTRTAIDKMPEQARRACVLYVCPTRSSFAPPSPRALGRCRSLTQTRTSIHVPCGFASALLSSDLSRTRRRCSRVRWGGGSLEPTHSPAPAMVCVCDQRGPAPQRWAGQHRRRACVFARMRQGEYLCGIGRRLGLLREWERGACVCACARRQTGREGCCAGRAVGHGRAQFAQGICGAS